MSSLSSVSRPLNPGPGRLALERIIQSELIPDFCADPDRQIDGSGFRTESIGISELDAFNFVKAWKAGLVQHKGRGLYRASKSAASEQFFWLGRKQPIPRSFTLWLEPVITVAALARLHFEFGWPADLIGTQSSDWAFDVVAFKEGETHEHIAGEVKKSVSELDQLVEYMKEFGRKVSSDVPAGSKPLNAYKKVAALRARRAPLFWAVGPAGYGHVYRVSYGPRGDLDLKQESEELLRFERCAELPGEFDGTAI